jgi:predicted RNA-binding protein with PIN domain
MIILIDGYNLLNHIFPGKKHALDKHKELLIKHLGLYKYQKPAVSDIMLVFDGGIFGHASRMVKEGIVILESGTKSTADDWIIAFAERHRGKEILLVTLDRALRQRVEQLGADWLSVFDFYNLMQSVIANIDDETACEISGDIVVYHREADEADIEIINKHVLDTLMEQASVIVQNKIEDKNTMNRRGKSYTPSKMEKQIAAKIKKLG